MRVAYRSLAIAAALTFVGLTLITARPRAQDYPMPPLSVGTCFTTLNTASAQFRVEAISTGWLRVTSTGDTNEPTNDIRVHSRWLNSTQLTGVTIISGFKACDFDR